MPWSLVEFMAGQLGMEDASVVQQYGARRATPYEHTKEITRRYGYLEATDAAMAVPLEEFVVSRAWLTDDGPVTLFERSVAWLRDRKVLLPGVSVLARLVARVRAEQSGRLHDAISELASDRLTDGRLDRLVKAGAERLSELERLRMPPSKASKGESRGRSSSGWCACVISSTGSICPSCPRPSEVAGALRVDGQGRCAS